MQGQIGVQYTYARCAMRVSPLTTSRADATRAASWARPVRPASSPGACRPAEPAGWPAARGSDRVKDRRAHGSLAMQVHREVHVGMSTSGGCGGGSERSATPRSPARPADPRPPHSAACRPLRTLRRWWWGSRRARRLPARRGRSPRRCRPRRQVTHRDGLDAACAPGECAARSGQAQSAMPCFWSTKVCRCGVTHRMTRSDLMFSGGYGPPVYLWASSSIWDRAWLPVVVSSTRPRTSA